MYYEYSKETQYNCSWGCSGHTERCKNKSAFIAEAVREYKKQKDKEKLIAELKEGYLSTAKEDLELSEEWEVAINDGI